MDTNGSTIKVNAIDTILIMYIAIVFTKQYRTPRYVQIQCDISSNYHRL